MRSAEERRRAKVEMLGRRPAFPNSEDDLAMAAKGVSSGMTLLEWFAGQALAGRMCLPLPVTVVEMQSGEFVPINFDATENVDDKVDEQLVDRMFSIAEKMVAEALRRRDGG